MKPFLMAAVALLAVFPGIAQDVVLGNPEDVDFHYVVDPPELAAFDPSSSIFPSVVYDYFATVPNGEKGLTVFAPLPAGSTHRLEGLTEGTHLLVGFFVAPGRREFPVRVIRLQAGEGLAERYYTIYTKPAFAAVRAGKGRLKGYPAIPPRLTEPARQAGAAAAAGTQEETVMPAGEGMAAPAATAPPAGATATGFFRFQIDNRYDDWDVVPPLAAFPSGYRPGSFTLERFGQELEVLPLQEARHWRDGGTSLSEVKIVRDERAVYFYASTYQAISDDLSVFLYLQSRRQGSRENRLTLELVPETGRAPGLVVLWEKDEEPVVVGRLASASFFLEAEVRNDVILPYLETVPDLSYFDLTTCYFDRGNLSYEEYYFGSPSFAEIPTPSTLF